MSDRKPWLDINKYIYVAVIVAPLANLPQLFKIWLEGTAEGVSALSWFSFAAISLVWLAYGVARRDKPIMCMNGALVCVQTMIAVGAVIY